MVTADLNARHSQEAVEEEIRVFEGRVTQFRSGEMKEDDFRHFRLKHGIYGQRQPGVQMVRVKAPSGILTPAQLRALAEIAERYSTNCGHVTTRQNVQFHFVQLENVAAVMRLLADAGLTTREACGNEVRNVTSCPLAGICGTEAFDVTPYALATTQFFLRHPEIHDLPRKFKIAFSGCEDDGNCAAAGIHDIGLIARVRTINGTEQRGFKVLVGGGLGSLPTEAATLNEFLSEEELVPTMEAILHVFAAHGNRKNKFKARMKFVLREKGIEEFRRLVAEARAKVQTPAKALIVSNPVRPPLVAISAASQQQTGDSVAFHEWMEHNFLPQRQMGYAVAWVKLLAGTVMTTQFRGLADLLEKYSLGAARIAISQDLVIPWVETHLARALYEDLSVLGLNTPGARTIADVTGCPGATTCNLGITRSHTLSEVLAKEFASETDPLAQEIRIKISGCPNSCGQHHIADIGLYGNARKVEGRQIPYYQLMLGGSVDGDGVQFARQVVALPARHVPQALRSLVDAYKSQRDSQEAFQSWVRRTSDAAICEMLAPYLGADGSDSGLFVDWGDSEAYSLKLGRGECAA